MDRPALNVVQTRPEDPVIPLGYLSPGLSRSQFFEIAIAHWKATLFIACAILALGAGLTKYLPKSYKATATLMVNYEVNDPLIGKDFPVLLMGSYMATQIELMKSSEILGPVAQRLNLAVVPRYSTGNRGGAATMEQWVESQLRSDIDIEQGRSSSQLIYITATSANPQLAAQIANAVAEVYADRQMKRTNTPGTDKAKRYSEQVEELKTRVDAAQEALSGLRKRIGAIDLEAKVDIELDLLATLERRLLDSRGAEREKRVRVIENAATSTQVMSSELVRSLRAESATLNARMAKLLTTLGPQHPQMIELQQQIEATDRSLAAAVSSYSDSANSEVRSAGREGAGIEQAVKAQREKVVASRQARDEAAKYQIELASAQAVYKRALESSDQATPAVAGRYSNVSIVSSAREPTKAAGPDRIVGLVLALVAGLILGVAVPFVYELFYRRVRCRDDVERDLGLPVLVEFRRTSAGAR